MFSRAGMRARKSRGGHATVIHHPSPRSGARVHLPSFPGQTAPRLTLAGRRLGVVKRRLWTFYFGARDEERRKISSLLYGGPFGCAQGKWGARKTQTLKPRPAV